VLEEKFHVSEYEDALNAGAVGAAYLYTHWHFTGQQFWGTYVLIGPGLYAIRER
jgi:hypothetical protein